MKAWISLFGALLLISSVHAQQAKEFGEYTVHYNALNTSQLTPAVAQAYSIQRSSSRALLNITVLKDSGAGQPGAVEASITANAKNLTGQHRDIELRKITEADEAIYYIGEFRVNNMETFDFTVLVTPDGASVPLEVKFRQQFYTE
jgi:hypothetical protein